MGGSRIYVGNLGVNVNKDQIKEKFSQYGNVVSIDLKNKLDIDGNAISQFAYLNLDAEPSKISSCLQDLNNIKIDGLYLKVDIARESFLDKLKREREQRDNPQPKESSFQTNSYNFDSNNYKESRYQSHYDRDAMNHDSYNKYDDSRNYDSYNKYDDSRNHDSYNKYDDSRNYDNSHNFSNNYNKSTSDYSQDYNSTNSGGYNSYDHNIKKNNVRSRESSEANEYATFKRYDPTVQDFKHPSKKKTQEEKSIETTKKFVHISSDLTFKGDSSGFSFLAKFSEQKDIPEHMEDDEDDNREHEVYEKEVFRNKRGSEDKNRDDFFPPVKTFYKPKTKNFFHRSSNANFQESVEWLLTPLTAENKAEFESVREELVSLYKLRQSRAVRVPNSKRRMTKNGGIGRSNYRFK